jgi:hypothetical protein
MPRPWTGARGAASDANVGSLARRSLAGRWGIALGPALCDPAQRTVNPSRVFIRMYTYRHALD